MQRGEIEIRRTHPTEIRDPGSDPITPLIHLGEREQRPFLCTVQEDSSEVDCGLFDSNKTEASTTSSLTGPKRWQ